MVKKVAFTTLGCKLNFSETSGISRQFKDSGYIKVDAKESADVYVINTCTVTEVANKKSRQAIKKMAKINPNAKIVVVGCYAQLKPTEVSAIEGVDLILGSDNKFSILENLSNIGNNTSTIIIDDKKKQVFNPTYSFGDRTRSFLKVQDGCNYYCSFCTIPKARGNSRNNSIVKTVLKAEEVVAKGIKEIILTGVNIGDFGKSTSETFFDLLKDLEQIKGLARLRISSIEPNLLTEEILTFVAKSKVIVPHFHIPLQCGTDNLLRLMRRRYTTTLYRSRVNFIKKLMPNACVAADVIVGVPGESEEEFKNTCEFIRSIEVSYLHVFTYSEREDTLATKMANQVSVSDKKNRSEIMHKIANEKQLLFKQQNLGRIVKVLFEGNYDSNYIYGFTDNYIKVQVTVDTKLINTIRDVELISIDDSGNVNAKLI